MIEIDLPTLTQCYVSRIDWYPPVQNPRQAPQRINGIADILDQFELIMLDSYGVLCRGMTPIDGAIEAMAAIRESGKAFCIVSNDTMTHRPTAVEKYAERGFNFYGGEVVTSLDITEHWLKTIANPQQWAYIAPENHPSATLLKGMTNLTLANGIIPEQITGLLFLSSGGWTAEKQHNLEQSAMARQFNMAIGNPDMGAPHSVGEQIHIYATPGYFCDRFVAATAQKATPVLFGKPDASIFREVAEQYKVTDPSKVLMVGDTLYTDILGGNAMGFQTLLLECGVYRGHDIDGIMAHANIYPTFIAPSLG